MLWLSGSNLGCLYSTYQQYVDIGPGPNQHMWGTVLLSKFPILNSTHHLLPSPDGELAPVIEAVLDMFGMEVTIVMSHNGQGKPCPMSLPLRPTLMWSPSQRRCRSTASSTLR